MLTLTERAAYSVKSIIEAQNKSFLKVGVKGGGCAGLEYTMELIDAPGESDVVCETNGVKIVCDTKSYLYINGTEIDYVESMIGGGFKFNNPQAHKSCGCGFSFDAKSVS